jgi:hypothetical protein
MSATDRSAQESGRDFFAGFTYRNFKQFKRERAVLLEEDNASPTTARMSLEMPKATASASVPGARGSLEVSGRDKVSRSVPFGTGDLRVCLLL